MANQMLNPGSVPCKPPSLDFQCRRPPFNQSAAPDSDESSLAAVNTSQTSQNDDGQGGFSFAAFAGESTVGPAASAIDHGDFDAFEERINPNDQDCSCNFFEPPAAFVEIKSAVSCLLKKGNQDCHYDEQQTQGIRQSDMPLRRTEAADSDDGLNVDNDVSPSQPGVGLAAGDHDADLDKEAVLQGNHQSPPAAVASSANQAHHLKSVSVYDNPELCHSDVATAVDSSSSFSVSVINSSASNFDYSKPYDDSCNKMNTNQYLTTTMTTTTTLMIKPSDDDDLLSKVKNNNNKATTIIRAKQKQSPSNDVQKNQLKNHPSQDSHKLETGNDAYAAGDVASLLNPCSLVKVGTMHSFIYFQNSCKLG